ncbi:MAG: hypothetical protein OXN89_15970 [Bryobacterales bacterium]|nr:hypothetical protein [Bryobacterales bacterium]
MGSGVGGGTNPDTPRLPHVAQEPGPQHVDRDLRAGRVVVAAWGTLRNARWQRMIQTVALVR